MVLSLFLSFTEFKHSVQNSRMEEPTMEESKKNTKENPQTNKKPPPQYPHFMASGFINESLWSQGLPKMEPNKIIPAKSKLFLRPQVCKWAV